jgi:hypothetical protein
MKHQVDKVRVISFKSLVNLQIPVVLTPLMKMIIRPLALLTSAFALCHCGAPTGPNTQRGAATGALVGAAAGGIIGHQSGRGLEGALIGGAAGGGAGALYGNARDQEQQRRY